MSCDECKNQFVQKHWNQLLCSDRCRQKRKNRSNLRLNYRERGFSGYGEKRCSICLSPFKPNTSKHLTCSSSCALSQRRKTKNKNQKIYNEAGKSRPEYVMKRMLRTCLGNMVNLKRKLHCSQRYCDFTAGEFKAHLESQFLPGMRWENWGEWHIDHKRPLSKFDLINQDGSENLDEIISANGLKNLQPLWALENLKKQDRYTG